LQTTNSSYEEIRRVRRGIDVSEKAEQGLSNQDREAKSKT